MMMKEEDDDDDDDGGTNDDDTSESSESPGTLRCCLRGRFCSVAWRLGRVLGWELKKLSKEQRTSMDMNP
jgi:hypothetical protein